MTTAAPTSPQTNGKGVLPLTAHRRLHCLLESTKAEVQEEKALRERHNFINSSPVTMKQPIGDPDNIAENLSRSIQAFTPAVRNIFEVMSIIYT